MRLAARALLGHLYASALEFFGFRLHVMVPYQCPCAKIRVSFLLSSNEALRHLYYNVFMIIITYDDFMVKMTISYKLTMISQVTVHLANMVDPSDLFVDVADAHLGMLVKTQQVLLAILYLSNQPNPEAKASYDLLDQENSLCMMDVIMCCLYRQQ